MYQCIAFITSNHAFFVIWLKIFFYYNENLKKLKKDKGRIFFVNMHLLRVDMCIRTSFCRVLTLISLHP